MYKNHQKYISNELTESHKTHKATNKCHMEKNQNIFTYKQPPNKVNLIINMWNLHSYSMT